MLDYKKFITDDDNIVIRYDSMLPLFDAAAAIDTCVSWIRSTFAETGATTAIVGISGGKDSSVTAALCVKALGADNVVGVKMPAGRQHDIDCAEQLIEHLGISSMETDIASAVSAIEEQVSLAAASRADIPMNTLSLQAKTNLPARIRLCVLYAISQSFPCSARVVGTANLSEAFVGWDTRYGGAGASGSDMLLLARYTASEVCAMGYVLGLPDVLIDKVPEDGLSGMSDEDNFGFTYEELDLYIRLGEHAPVNENVRKKIDEMHRRGEFKLHMPPACPSGLCVLA